MRGRDPQQRDRRWSGRESERAVAEFPSNPLSGKWHDGQPTHFGSGPTKVRKVPQLFGKGAYYQCLREIKSSQNFDREAAKFWEVRN